MTTDELQRAMNEVRNRAEQHCMTGRRRKLLNERFFHHMFSLFASPYLWAGNTKWQTLSLIPECPTEQRFRAKNMNLKNPGDTRGNAVGQGQRGNLDFQICQPAPNPTFSIEWKGPKLFSAQDMAWVLLKLLTQPPEHYKVVAALITSSRTSRADHQAALVAHFNKALTFVQKVLRISEIASSNLYGYIASISDTGTVELCWGHIVGPVRIDQ